MSKNKKIVIATGIYPPDIGGPATYASLFRDNLIKKGWQVEIVSFGEKNKKDEEANISKISRKWPKGLRHLIYLRVLSKVSVGADLIYALNATSAGVPARRVSKKLGIPLVLRIVGDDAWQRAQINKKTVFSINDFQRSDKKGYIKYLHNQQIKTASEADLVITPSNFLANLISGWAIEKSKIKVVNNGVDFSSLPISKEDARKEIGISGRVILSIGRLVPWKGFRMLIKIMPELLRKNPFYRLVIIGSGPEKKGLENMIKNMNLQKKVYLIDKMEREKIKIFFSSADVFVLNTFYEGFSHLIIEAMALGVPVITTNVCGNPEIVEQGENGFLVKFNDDHNLVEAINTITNDNEIKEFFINNGRKTASRLTTKKMIDETVSILESLISLK